VLLAPSDLTANRPYCWLPNRRSKLFPVCGVFGGSRRRAGRPPASGTVGVLKRAAPRSGRRPRRPDPGGALRPPPQIQLCIRR
jgi:hypothetical protein